MKTSCSPARRSRSKLLLLGLALSLSALLFYVWNPVQPASESDLAPTTAALTPVPPGAPTGPATVASKAHAGAEEREDATLWHAFDKAALAIHKPVESELAQPGNAGVQFFAANPRQQLTARFLGSEVRLGSGAGGRWQLGVRGAAWGRADAVTDTPAGPPPVASEDSVRYARGGLVEWFRNVPEGLEHGFTLMQRPAGAGEVRVDVALDGLRAANRPEGMVLSDAAGREVLGYSGLKVWDAEGRDLPARMQATDAGISILVADAGATYPVTIDPLFTSFEASLNVSALECGRSDDALGHAVGVFGDLAVVGAPGDDTLAGNDTGAAYIFERSGTAWSLKVKLKASDAAAGDRLGGALAVGDGFALVGARLADLRGKADAGAVYVFSLRRGFWTQTGKLTARDSLVGAEFGESIALDESTAAIGAPGHSGERGAAYVFAREGVAWRQQARLLADGGLASDRFGDAVAVSGDADVLVGAPGQGGKGAAYVFGRSGLNWTQRQVLAATGGAAGDLFGTAVGLDGSQAVIGAPGRDTAAGADAGEAYLFTYASMTWSQAQVLTPADAAAGDVFGIALAQQGPRVLIGAPGADVNSTADRGAAYLFGPESTPTWVQQARLTAPSGVAGDWFGGATALHQTTALIGAYLADSPGWDGGTVENLGGAHVFRVFGSNTQEIVVTEEDGEEELENGNSLDFGPVTVGLQETRSFVIRNLGSQPLGNLKTAVSGSHASQFRVVNSPPATLAPGASFTLEIAFSPNSVGPKQGLLRFTSNDASEGTLEVTLTGSGEEAYAPEFEFGPESQIVAVGERARLLAGAFGEPDPTLQWRKNGRVLRNKTSSSLGFIAALTDAGTYDVRATNRAGSTTSDPAEVAVVDTGLTVLNLPAGGTAVMKVIAAGNDLGFQWFFGAEPVDLEDSRVSLSADGKTLTITQLTSADNGMYSCLVTAPGGFLHGGRHELNVFSHAPEFGEFELPDAYVTCPYDFQLPYNTAPGFRPSLFSASGLPKNLTIDPQSGRLGGLPVGAGGTTHSVTFTASNASGSTSVTKTLHVRALPCGLVGKFRGLVERDGGLNGGFGGSIEMTITAAGGLSGSLTLGAAKHPFASTVVCPSESSVVQGEIMVERKGLGPVLLRYAIDLYEGRFEGTITDHANTVWQFSLFAGSYYESGSTDGLGSAARFSSPSGIARDRLGNLFLADTANHVIRRITPAGQVSTFAGVAGQSGLANGCDTEVRFNAPRGVAVDALGFVYVADTGNRVIRRITPEGKVSTFAGTGDSGSSDGPGTSATFMAPYGIALGAEGVLYVSDAEAHTVRRIGTDAAVTTLAGKAGVSGAKNGSGTNAEFCEPRGLAELAPGVLLVCDSGNHCLRQILTKNRAVTTFAGGLGVGGDVDGSVVNARFLYPSGVTAQNGIAYVADTGNGTIRRVNKFGVVTTITDSCEDEYEQPSLVPPDHYGRVGCHVDERYAPFYEPLGIVLSGRRIFVTDAAMHIVSAGAAGEACDVPFEGVRNPWGNDSYPYSENSAPPQPGEICYNPPASQYAGTYNFILDPENRRLEGLQEANGENGYHGDPPEGTGFGTLTVKTDGTVLIAATLADGTTVTGSSILGGTYYDYANSVPLFFMLYRNTGSLLGWHEISSYYNDTLQPPPTEMPMSNYVNGCMTWMKIPQLSPTETNYRYGFPTHLLQVIGEQFDSTSYASLVGSFFYPGEENAELFMSGGNLDEWFERIFTFNANGTATMPDNLASFSFNKSNGRFSGSFKHASPLRTTPYQGVFLRRLDGGYGFFLNDLGSAILSGSAEFGPGYNYAD